MKDRTALPILILLCCLCIAATAQQSQVALTYEGLDGAKLTFTLDQLRQMPQLSVALPNPHTKTLDKFEGVLLADLLAKAGAPSGDKLRGDEMRDYVEVTGSDGYRAVFALAELDSAFQDNNVMLAITSGGKPLDAHEGPVRVVAPQDKRPARSVRMVTSIALRRAP